jgi:hypothetical protein
MFFQIGSLTIFQTIGSNFRTGTPAPAPLIPTPTINPFNLANTNPFLAPFPEVNNYN